MTLLGGAALMILFCLLYQAMWRPRREEETEQDKIKIEGPATFFSWLLGFMPWAVVLVILATTIYTITHLWAAAVQLPNW